MKLILFFAVILISTSSHAEEIASCYNPSGTVYFPEYGNVAKKDAGWRKDKIQGGIIKLSKIGNDKFDILFVDATKTINSTIEEGGKVLLFSLGQNMATFLVVYPTQTAETYTFLKTTSGIYEYIHMTSRSGSTALVTKASIMRGDCDPINFEDL